ncbi:hypothetical protein ABFS83_10G062800 [Erythranthe nasuta]
MGWADPPRLDSAAGAYLAKSRYVHAEECSFFFCLSADSFISSLWMSLMALCSSAVPSVFKFHFWNLGKTSAMIGSMIFILSHIQNCRNNLVLEMDCMLDINILLRYYKYHIETI